MEINRHRHDLIHNERTLPSSSGRQDSCILRNVNKLSTSPNSGVAPALPSITNKGFPQIKSKLLSSSRGTIKESGMILQRSVHDEEQGPPGSCFLLNLEHNKLASSPCFKY